MHRVLLIHIVLHCYCILTTKDTEICLLKVRVYSSAPSNLSFLVMPHQPSARLPPLITDYKPPHNAEINKHLTFAPCPITQYPRLSTCLINIHIPQGWRGSSLLHHPSHIRPVPLGPLGRRHCLPSPKPCWRLCHPPSFLHGSCSAHGDAKSTAWGMLVGSKRSIHLPQRGQV